MKKLISFFMVICLVFSLELPTVSANDVSDYKYVTDGVHRYYIDGYDLYSANSDGTNPQLVLHLDEMDEISQYIDCAEDEIWGIFGEYFEVNFEAVAVYQNKIFITASWSPTDGTADLCVIDLSNGSALLFGYIDSYEYDCFYGDENFFIGTMQICGKYFVNMLTDQDVTGDPLKFMNMETLEIKTVSNSACDFYADENGIYYASNESVSGDERFNFIGNYEDCEYSIRYYDFKSGADYEVCGMDYDELYKWRVKLLEVYKADIESVFKLALSLYGDTYGYVDSSGKWVDNVKYTEYTLYDIDKDNVPELIIRAAMDSLNYVYKYKDNKAILCGDIDAYRSNGLYEYPDGNGIVAYAGGMGTNHFEWVNIISIICDKLVENTVIDSTTKDYEEIRNVVSEFTPISGFLPRHDLSLLNTLNKSKINVSIAPSTIVFNGTSLRKDVKYPFIVYNDVTYFPLTYQNCLLAGIESSWSSAGGLELYTTGASGTYNPELGYSGELKARKADFPVRLNNKEVSSSEYPIIVCNDVTYIPLTWEVAVNMFAWNFNYVYDNDGGVIYIEN